MASLTIDIGGTASKVIVFEEGSECTSYQIPTRASLGISYLKEDIFSEVEKNIKKYDVKNIGISTAGIVDSNTGRIEEVGGAFKDYVGFSWTDEIKKVFDIDAVVENDVKCAGLGEYYYGSNKKYESMYVLTIGTGIGGCFIDQGKIYRGHFATAGEIGYIPREDSNIGALASTSGLIRRANKIYPEKGFSDGKEIFDAYLRREIEATALVGYLIQAIAELLGSIILILEPEVILVGGAISAQEDALLDPIKEILKREIPKKVYENVNIKTTSLGNKASCYGAYALTQRKNSN